jgi:protein-disulfide isomerase
MGKRVQRKKRRAARRRRKLAAILSALVLVVGAGVAFMSTGAASPDPAVTVRPDVEISKGPADAPITIVEYGDFNCPACKAYHQYGIIDQVLASYPEQVRFVFRHFPVITADSPRLAEAVECAYDQGAHLEFHDGLFQISPSRPNDAYSVAAQLGLDQEQFEQCYDGRHYRGLVQAQLREALSHGFRGTPSFMVNDTPLAGPPNYDFLVSIIEGYLTQENP